MKKLSTKILNICIENCVEGVGGVLSCLLTLTPSPPFSFLDYLLGKGGVQKWGFPA